MVDFPHLSEGNSDSSPSRDLYAAHGISPPISQHSCGSSCGDMSGSSSDAKMLGPENLSTQSASSSANSDGIEIGQINLNQTQMSDIFRAAHQLTQNDRLMAAEERKKNKDLMSFIEASGHSMLEVNSFLSREGRMVTVSDDDTRTISLVRHESPLNNQVLLGKAKEKGAAECLMGSPSAEGSELNLDRVEREMVPLACLPIMEEQGASLARPTQVGLLPLGRGSAGSSSNMGLMETRLADRSLPVEAGKLRGTGTADRRLEPVAQRDTLPDKQTTVETDPTAPKTLQKTWASVVLKEDKLPKINLSFHPPSLENGTITIKPPPEVLKQGNSLWSTCLVGSFQLQTPFQIGGRSCVQTLGTIWP